MYKKAPFIELGKVIGEILKEYPPEFSERVHLSCRENPWFTENNILKAIIALKERMLSPSLIDEWLSRYPEKDKATGKNIGVVMAGNIPLVGFFDMMCVVISGHGCHIKPSSKDSVLTEFMVKLLREAKSDIPIFRLEETSQLDAVIATGSDNTSRYFRSRYSSVPALIRGSRTSVAVLSGRESASQLALLGDDVFSYFGMGCRNVSRIFVPDGFEIGRLTNAFIHQDITFPKYLNTYRQQKAVLAMRGEKFEDGGFFTLRESGGQSDALSDIIYTRYRSQEEAKKWLAENDKLIQCVVTESVQHPRRVDFGKAQQPELWDYPDGKDVMEFLANI